ncbi:MAG: 1,4-alpha-glucan branching protein GlgB [Ktedonobacterales bacterium]
MTPDAHKNTIDTVEYTVEDPLDAGNLDALVAGRHGAPFDILGPHRLLLRNQVWWVVRAFIPGAGAVTLLPAAATRRSGATGEAEAGALPMKMIHQAGLFSVVGRGELPAQYQPHYQLLIQRGLGEAEWAYDPYTFAPLLSDFDLYLIGEGTHEEIYERLGAHPRIVDGIAGVSYAVWAPNARRVSVVGDFNGWSERAHPMRLASNGIWELFLPGISIGSLYKYAILSWNHGYNVLKADPYALAAEVRPGTASRVWDLGGYVWGDTEWLQERGRRNGLDAPISIYEVHLGSWMSPSQGETGLINYRDFAHRIVEYAKDLHYTHIELLPITEYPADSSWGYQVTGYFAPTSRYGTPQDFMYLVDHCHQNGIGVLMDWVPGHFIKDEHGLGYFDGTHLYEHADPRQGEHEVWGTLIFNFGRNEVRNFLMASALFWLDKYHIDGLRVDAVASMLYLDFGRKHGQWLPNRYGGRENLEAVSFLRSCNKVIHQRFPGVLMMAEESTAWPYVTAPVEAGGLGFTLKWNMGWMHDILQYLHYDPIYRSFHQNDLTFSFTYTHSERFILPLSHDEVVHIKGSLLNKMPGDRWQKFANLRALYGLMYAHPGKKLLFMGGEIGQWSEWNYAGYLDWYMLDPERAGDDMHRRLQGFVRDLNRLLVSEPSLHQCDILPEGFAWIDGSDTKHSVIAFIRYAEHRSHPLIFVCNFTPTVRYGYRIGVPFPGQYAEIFNSDAEIYGGSNVGNLGRVQGDPEPMHGYHYSIPLTLPPLAVIALRPLGTAKQTKGALSREITPTTSSAPVEARSGSEDLS